MVVMDKQDYIEMLKYHLGQPTHRVFTSDLMSKYKAKLIDILKRIKKESEIDDNMYK